MLKTYFLFFLSLLPVLIYSQQREIRGFVYDSPTNKPLENANVLLLHAKDSTMVQYCRTDKKGEFHLNLYDSFSYLLSISYPNAADYLDTIKFTKDTFFMISRIEAIREILIKKYQNGIRLSGDTTEYLADFFKTNPGATAEDLLRKLPGVQINRNGEITAQGEKVKQILVDGEEFFMDDPTIATKYLKAEMIEKVQVYNQKGDTNNVNQESVKTINLTLKDGKKKGYFGKLSAGSNLDQYHNGGVFLGAFRKNSRSAGFAKTSTFENGSLNWGDSREYGGSTGGSYSYNAEGGYYTGNSSFGDDLDNQGIPYSSSAGATFSGKIDSAGKFKYNVSYRFANEGIKGTATSRNTYFFPDTSYNARDTTYNTSNQNGHRISSRFTLAIDSFNSLDINLSGSYNDGQTTSKLQSVTATNAESRINGSTRELTNSYSRFNLSAGARFNHNFRKAGRQFYISTLSNFNPSLTNQGINSSNSFFNSGGSILKQSSFNQKTEINNGSNSLAVSIGFNERLSKNYTYSLFYNLNTSNQKNTTSASNADNNAIIDSLSNDFLFKQVKNVIGYSLNYKKKKTSAYLNISGGQTRYAQNDRKIDSALEYTFWNILPSAGITYAWKKQQSISFNYSGSTNAPSISNMRPAVSNQNPLNLSVGNPDLRQSFTHRFSAFLASYKTLKGRYTHGNLIFQLPRNAFLNTTEIDSFGIRRNKVINGNGNYSMSEYLEYSFKIKKTPIGVDLSQNFSSSRNLSYSNGVKIQTDNMAVSGGISLDIELDFLYLELNYDFSFNTSTNTSVRTTKTKYIVHSPEYQLYMELPWKFGIESSGTFNIRPASGVFSTQRNIFYMVASINKFFGKKNEWECKFFINDILNQNAGFNRNISTNVVSEQVYTQISRAWIFTLVWNFGNNGGKN